MRTSCGFASCWEDAGRCDGGKVGCYTVPSPSFWLNLTEQSHPPPPGGGPLGGTLYSGWQILRVAQRASWSWIGLHRVWALVRPIHAQRPSTFLAQKGTVPTYLPTYLPRHTYSSAAPGPILPPACPHPPKLLSRRRYIDLPTVSPPSRTKALPPITITHCRAWRCNRVVDAVRVQFQGTPAERGLASTS
jgi:hypothetical protein